MSKFILHSFNDLRDQWTTICQKASTRLLFSSPAWSETWWQHFSQSQELYLGAVTEDDQYIGIAPLRIHNGVAAFIGSDDVCDFLDFPVLPGYEMPFFHIMIKHLKQAGIRTLDLSPLLAESTVIPFLEQIARDQGADFTRQQQDVTVNVDLPSEINSYLASLSGKQRHELLRKERRLNEEGNVSFTSIEKPEQWQVDTFFRFFRESRDDKKAFLTGDMEGFFRSIFQASSDEGILRLGMLELNSQPVAMTLCFDYRNEVYLYNSGYQPEYRWISAGLISKYYCIKDSIQRGKSRFDFLKGAEKYKFHLGGKEQPVYRCIIKY
jgi:CelD/BcsL family acetyltransferase involved in cellulose biosynthesis